jgi:hypothetical protein
VAAPGLIEVLVEVWVDGASPVATFPAKSASSTVDPKGAALLLFLHIPSLTQAAGWVASQFLCFSAALGLVQTYKEVTMTDSNETINNNSSKILGYARNFKNVFVVPLAATLLAAGAAVVVGAAGGIGPATG